MTTEDITALIPQRDPILMVDALLEAGPEGGVTSLTVRPGNFFLNGDGRMEESGLLEHIAQSASAVAGHQAIAAGATAPPTGYIGEIKKFHCHRLPRTGEELRTTITFGAEVNGVTLLTGETRAAGELLADTQMKIYLPEEQN